MDEQRTLARERAAAVSWALAVALEADRRLTDAGSWARRAARHASTDERVLRRVVTMLDRLGDRAGAVKLYEDFAARLRADLNVEPSPDTTAVVNAMRSR